MRLKIKRIDKKDAEPIFDLINSDYHNGDCMLISLLHEPEVVTESPEYIVLDFPEYLLLIYYDYPLNR